MPPGGDGSRERPAACPSTTGSPTPSPCRGSSAGRSGASRRSSSPPTSAPTFRSPPPPRAASRAGSASAACGCSPPSGPPSRWPGATFSPGSPGCSSGTPSRGARRCGRRRTWPAFTGCRSSSPCRASPSTSRGSGCPDVSPGAALPLIPGVAAVLFLVLYGRILPANPAGPAARTPEVKVAIAQGGIDQSVKWDPANQLDTLEIYEELTRRRGTRARRWWSGRRPRPRSSTGGKRSCPGGSTAIAASGGDPAHLRGAVVRSGRGREILQQRLPHGRARRRSRAVRQAAPGSVRGIHSPAAGPLLPAAS